MHPLPLLLLVLVAPFDPLRPAQEPDAEKITFAWKFGVGQIHEWTLSDLREDSSSVEFVLPGSDPHAPMEHSSTNEFTLVRRDEVLAVASGVPIKIGRVYSEIDQVMAFGEHEMESSSPLVDHELLLDATGEELEVTAVEEDFEIPEAMEKHLAIDADLGAFLPRDAVAVGGSWELDAKALHRVLGQGRGLLEREEFTIEEGSTRIQLHGGPSGSEGEKVPAWEGECTLREIVVKDGHRVAIVELEGTLEVEPPMAPDLSAEEEGGGVAIVLGSGGEGRTEELEGRFEFDLDAGYLRSLELEISSESSASSEQETEIGTISFSSVSNSSRKVDLRVERIEAG